jgi:hypothetical protein
MCASRFSFSRFSFFAFHGLKFAQLLELRVEQLVVPPILLLSLLLCTREVPHQHRVTSTCHFDAFGSSLEVQLPILPFEVCASCEISSRELRDHWRQDEMCQT